MTKRVLAKDFKSFLAAAETELEPSIKGIGPTVLIHRFLPHN